MRLKVLALNIKRFVEHTERKWRHNRVLRSTYLSNVRGRLLNDVAPYFRAIEQEAKAGRYVGFFALARLIFPVVEAVSSVIYRPRQRERQPVRLLKELGFEYPNLV